MNKCVVCGKEFEGFGNNPYPLADKGECCDNCNTKVIIARIKQLQEKKEN